MSKKKTDEEIIEQQAEDKAAPHGTVVTYTKLLDRTSEDRIEASQEIPPGMTEEQFFEQNPTYEPSGGSGGEEE